VFATSIISPIADATVSVGGSSTGFAMEGAIITGVNSTVTLADVSAVSTSGSLPPNTKLSNIAINGNATCGALSFNFTNVMAGTYFNIAFPSDFVYTCIPVIVTSASDAGSSELVSTGGAYFEPYIVTSSNTIQMQITIPNDVRSTSMKTAKFSYAVFGTTVPIPP